MLSPLSVDRKEQKVFLIQPICNQEFVKLSCYSCKCVYCLNRSNYFSSPAGSLRLLPNVFSFLLADTTSYNRAHMFNRFLREETVGSSSIGEHGNGAATSREGSRQSSSVIVLSKCSIKAVWKMPLFVASQMWQSKCYFTIRKALLPPPTSNFGDKLIVQHLI